MASQPVPMQMPQSFVVSKIKSGPNLGKLGLKCKRITTFDVKGDEREYILLESAGEATVLLPTPIIKSVNGKDVKPAKLNTFVDLIVGSGLDSIPMELIPLPEKWTLDGSEKLKNFRSVLRSQHNAYMNQLELLHKINHKYQRKHGIVAVQLSPLDSEVYSTNNGDGSSGGAENSANDIDKGLSLSHMPTEKEELLFNMLDSNGEIKQARDVKDIVVLCKKCGDAFATLVMTILMRTKSSKILREFMECGGATVLKRWLKQYFANKDEELMTLMLDVLSIIPMSEKAAKDSKIGITLRNIAKVEGLNRRKLTQL